MATDKFGNELDKAVLTDEHGDVMVILHCAKRGLTSKTVKADGKVVARNTKRGDISLYRGEIKRSVKWGWTLISDNSRVDED